MFARVTEYKMKPGSKDAATTLMHSLKDQILGMPGMHNFINVMTEVWKMLSPMTFLIRLPREMTM